MDRTSNSAESRLQLPLFRNLGSSPQPFLNNNNSNNYDKLPEHVTPGDPTTVTPPLCSSLPARRAVERLSECVCVVGWFVCSETSRQTGARNGNTNWPCRRRAHDVARGGTQGSSPRSITICSLMRKQERAHEARPRIMTYETYSQPHKLLYIKRFHYSQGDGCPL